MDTTINSNTNEGYIFCEKCGERNKATTKFCIACGNKIKKDTTEDTPAPVFTPVSEDHTDPVNSSNESREAVSEGNLEANSENAFPEATAEANSENAFPEATAEANSENAFPEANSETPAEASPEDEKQDYIEAKSAFAEGLPTWSIEPPDLLVRRR